MALFGRKGKNAAQGTDAAPASADTGTMTVDPGTDFNGDSQAFEAQEPVAVKAKGKKPKPPKSSKGVKSGTVVGLNIGSNYIKAVEVTSKGGRLTVTAMGAVPTPPDSISNGVVMSVGALAEALKELWRTAGIKSKTVVSSVSGTGSLVVRVIEVPKMTDRELSDNMKVDADRYIPFPPSEVVMDFKALRELPSDPDSPNMEVLLAAAQREIIDLHIRAVQSARLDPRAIDVEPLAAVRALQFAHGIAQGSDWVDYSDVSALVNIGATTTEISVLRGDLVVFTRTVPGGGNALTQAVADGLGLSFPDAERVKVDSADALPPHGMETMPVAGADVDDFAGFGLDEDTAPISFDDFDTTPMGGGQASTDPFDLDFFNQGPKQDEPGVGHGQKEGEDKPNDPFSFNFSFADDAATPAEEPARPAAPAPTASPAPAVSSFSLEGDAAKTAAPEPVSAPAEPASTEFVHAGTMEFSEDEFALPSQSATPVAEPVTPPAPAAEIEGNLLPSRETAPDPNYDMTAAAPDRGGISFNFDDDSLLPSVDTSPSLAPEEPGTDASVLPSKATPVPLAISGPVPPPAAEASPAPAEPQLPSIADASATFTPLPSAFDFGDLDLPTLEAGAPPPTEVSAGIPWTTPSPEPAPAPEAFVAAAPVEPAPVTAETVAEAPAPEPAPAEAVSTPFSFAFGDEPPAAAAPAPEPAPATAALEPETSGFEAPTQPFSFGETPEPAAETSFADEDTFAINPGDAAPAAQPESFEAGGAGDFDLDEIFGGGAAVAGAGIAGASVASAAPTAAAPVGAGDDTFDLGSIGGDLGDFDGGLTGDFDASPDLSNFGAGLTGEQSMAGVDTVALYGAVHPVVEDLANELRRSLEYHLSRFPDASISRISLIGGGAALLNLDYYLTQMLGIPTTVGNPFSQIDISAPRLPPDYPQDNGAICTIALGLALRDFVA